MADKDKGYWFSLENGKHVHVGEGETPKEATEKALKKVKKGSKSKYNEDELEDNSNDFDTDLAAAFKKYGPDDDAILDELRASGKDYGMSNGDLQAVVEAYTMNHFDDDIDEDFEEEEDDWSKWATETDKKVPENWKSDGWDGDTRFYAVNNQKGMRSASINPDGYTTLYTENGAVTFKNLDEAKEFMNLKTRQEAEDYLWDKNGYIDENSENAYDDMFSEFEEDEEDELEDNDMHYEKQPDGTIKESWSGAKYQDKKDLEDKAGSGALNHVRKKEETENKPQIITSDVADNFLKDNGLDKDFYFDGADLVDKNTGEDTGIVVGRNGAEKEFLLNRINEYKKQRAPQKQEGPMSYDQAKKYIKERTGADLTEEVYNEILRLGGRK